MEKGYNAAMKYFNFWMWLYISLELGLVMFLHRVLNWGFIPILASAMLLGVLVLFFAWKDIKHLIE